MRGLLRHGLTAMRRVQFRRNAVAGAQERPHQLIPVPLLDRTGVLMKVLLLFFALAACRAEIIDRVAVVVGNSVITESEILREIRLTAFLNGEPLDFSPASKRKTAERLVEQRLIRIEADSSLYPPPEPDAVETQWKEVQSKFASP